MVSFDEFKFSEEVCGIESSKSVIIVDMKNLVSNVSGLQGDEADNVLPFIV